MPRLSLLMLLLLRFNIEWNPFTKSVSQMSWFRFTHRRSRILDENAKIIRLSEPIIIPVVIIIIIVKLIRLLHNRRSWQRRKEYPKSNLATSGYRSYIPIRIRKQTQYHLNKSLRIRLNQNRDILIDFNRESHTLTPEWIKQQCWIFYNLRRACLLNT